MAKKVRKIRKTRARRVKKRVTRKRQTVKRKGVRPGKKKVVKKKAKAPPRTPKLPQEPIGRVTHYFPKVRASAVMIERDRIQPGDILYFKGHTTRFKQKVESLQVNRQPVSEASPGEEVGIQVRARTREHDLVFKLQPA